jgi:hypothetical protein
LKTGKKIQMKKRIIIIIFVTVTILIAWMFIFGGFVIPLSKEIDSEEIYGIRLDIQGDIAEQILKREIRRNCYVILGPDGPGKNYWTYNQYLFKNNHLVIELPHLYKFEAEDIYDITSPILPISGTSTWLAIKVVQLKIGKVGDIDVVIFDKHKIHSRVRITDCHRLQPGAKNEIFAIDYKEGNLKAVFYTAHGNYLYDTSMDKLSKMDAFDGE